MDTLLYDLKLSRRLNSMKSSRVISPVRCLYETDVSRTISVLIIRDLIRDIRFLLNTKPLENKQRVKTNVPAALSVCASLLASNGSTYG